MVAFQAAFSRFVLVPHDVFACHVPFSDPTQHNDAVDIRVLCSSASARRATGSIPGSTFRKPFICPADHVLDLEGGWHKQLPEQDFGPHVREGGCGHTLGTASLSVSVVPYRERDSFLQPLRECGVYPSCIVYLTAYVLEPDSVLLAAQR
jgi:hypothetical protein